MTDSTYKTVKWSELCDEAKARNETNDCSVRAIAAAGFTGYTEAHDAMANRGRKHRRGAYLPDIIKAAEDLGMAPRKIRDYSARTMTTAARDRRLARGQFLVFTRSHVAAVVDGDVVDWTDGRRHRITSVYQVNKAKTPDLTPEPESMKPMSHFDQGSLF